MRDFINIKFDPCRTVKSGPVIGGVWTGCLPLWLVTRAEKVGGEGGGPSVRCMSSDDVTGSQSKLPPGGWKKKARCVHVLLVNVKYSLHQGGKKQCILFVLCWRERKSKSRLHF